MPVADLLGLTAEHVRRRSSGWPTCWAASTFLAKVYLGVIFMMWLRWTLPRLRIDQVMATCLKYCVPLASIMLVGAMLWMFFFPGGLVSEIFTRRPPKRSRENLRRRTRRPVDGHR